MMEQELKIGERISELLTVKGIDNKTFAGSLGVNVSTVGRWKSNAKYMRLSQIIAVANYFACSLDFLVGRSDIVLDFQPQTCPPFYPHLRKLLKEKGISHILSLIELADYLNVTLDMLAGREKI